MRSSNSYLHNPYVAGDPISKPKDDYWGRRDVLRNIERLFFSQNQNTAIIFGQRRIGKTTVLLQLKHYLDSNRFVVIYQDLMDKATIPFGEVLMDIAYTIALELDMPEPKLEFDNEGHEFQKKFLPEAYKMLPTDNHQIVLLFDEFDVIDTLKRESLPETFAANQFFKTLRRWMSEEPLLKFGFAQGRNLDDLDTDYYATFRSAQVVSISNLDRQATVDLINTPDTLKYSDEAIDRIWQFTQGHPFLTQLLCQLIFEQLIQSSEDIVPQVMVSDVERAVPKVFQVGDNVLNWIWDGLPPSERIFASALSELLAKDDMTVSEEEIVDHLQEKSVRIMAPELRYAPRKLVEWGLLKEIDGDYLFEVPLIQLWIYERKSLERIQDEVDRINPRAQRYFALGKFELEANDLENAIRNFENALRVNPEHLQARLSLAEAYLEDGVFNKAVKQYEKAYQRDKIRSQPGLIKALFVRSESTENLSQVFEDFERILEIQPNHQEALNRYSSLGLIFHEKTTDSLLKLKRAVREQNWTEVLRISEDLHSEVPDSFLDREYPEIDRYEKLATLNLKADKAYQSGKLSKAIKRYEEIASIIPEDKDAEDKVNRIKQERRRVVRNLKLFSLILPLMLGALGFLLGLQLGLLYGDLWSSLWFPWTIAIYALISGANLETFILEINGPKRLTVGNAIGITIIALVTVPIFALFFGGASYVIGLIGIYFWDSLTIFYVISVILFLVGIVIATFGYYLYWNDNVNKI